VLVAVLVALGASHAFLAVRAAVRHLLVRLVWRGSKEEETVERAGRDVKEAYLRSVEGKNALELPVDGVKQEFSAEEAEFWGVDEGLEEIRRSVKDV
jgi:anoctamin-10